MAMRVGRGHKKKAIVAGRRVERNQKMNKVKALKTRGLRIILLGHCAKRTGGHLNEQRTRSIEKGRRKKKTQKFRRSPTSVRNRVTPDSQPHQGLRVPLGVVPSAATIALKQVS